jgi:uncharacterized membrane protein
MSSKRAKTAKTPELARFPAESIIIVGGVNFSLVMERAVLLAGITDLGWDWLATATISRQS